MKGGEALRCKICGSEAVSEYCEFHEKAYENVVKKYDSWRQALEISWEDYLREIAENQLTGKWAREVAEYLIRKGEERHV